MTLSRFAGRGCALLLLPAIVLALLCACRSGDTEVDPSVAAFAAGLSKAPQASQLIRPASAGSGPRSASMAGSEIGAERLFRWAQLTYPSLFPDSPPIVELPFNGTVYEVRAYVSGNYLGIANGRVYGLGPFTGEELHDFGPIGDFAPAVCATIGCGSTAPEVAGVDSSVQVYRPYTEAIKEIVVRRQYVSRQSFSGDLGGNVQALSGRTIVIVVEDPAGMFEASGGRLEVEPGPRGWTYTLKLLPKSLGTVGRFAGTLRIFACLDSPVCPVRLAGTPVEIPYDVTVIAGCSLSSDRIEATVPFGSMPPEVTVEGNCASPVTDAFNWTFERPYPSASNPHINLLTNWTEVSKTRTVFTHQFGPMSPGTYRETWTVKNTLEASGRLFNQSRLVEVIYTVTPTDIWGMPVPARLDYRLGVGQTETGSYQLDLVRSTGQQRYVGVEYLSHPPSETDSDLLANWVERAESRTLVSFLIRPRTCRAATATAPARCLGVGTYTANIRLRAERFDEALAKMVGQDFLVPVSLIIGP